MNIYSKSIKNFVILVCPHVEFVVLATVFFLWNGMK